MNKIPIMNYLNYREYLRDVFHRLKSNDPTFSQKRIQFELGVSSSGFISNILIGRKNLTANQAAKMTRILKMDHFDATYFEALVMYTQARTNEEKEEFYHRCLKVRPMLLANLSVKEMSLFAKWYYVAVREVIDLISWKEDWSILANSVKPKISVEEAKEAVEKLLQLGLIRKNDNGVLVTCDAGISTGDEVSSEHLIEFQRATMKLASKALDEVDAEMREISVLTMGLSEGSFQNIKKEIRYFRKKMAKIAMEDKNANRVYQLNFQFFPLSENLKEE